MARQRENEKFKENPFLKHTTEITKIGQKKMFSPADPDKFMITNTQTGEAIPAGIYCHREVAKNEFVQLYAEGAAAIMGLKSAGQKVFQILYGKLLGIEGKNATEILMNYEMFPEEIQNWISRRTFFRGINELLKAKFIAQSYNPGYYFVNPAFIFNGNRLIIARAYTMQDKNEPYDIRQLAGQLAEGKQKKAKGKTEEKEPNLFEKIEQ